MIFLSIIKKEVTEHIVNIIDNLEMTHEQKEKIKIKAFVVLDDFILRVENQQQITHFNTKGYVKFLFEPFLYHNEYEN